jgi:hypothetical protein
MFWHYAAAGVTVALVYAHNMKRRRNLLRDVTSEALLAVLLEPKGSPCSKVTKVTRRAKEDGVGEKQEFGGTLAGLESVMCVNVFGVVEYCGFVVLCAATPWWFAPSVAFLTLHCSVIARVTTHLQRACATALTRAPSSSPQPRLVNLGYWAETAEYSEATQRLTSLVAQAVLKRRTKGSGAESGAGTEVGRAQSKLLLTNISCSWLS